MEDAKDWERHAGAWLELDHRLMTDASGWRPILERADLQIWSRRMPDDPNLLFRWHVPSLEASVETVFEGFVRRVLDYHKHWRREFVDGRVVETLGPEARILYQRFDPGIPGISRRDLCSIEVTRELGPGARIASFRSVDRLPRERGHERIDWWGAALCTAHEDGLHSSLTYLDRENQGGSFPAWLMNRSMPRYLVMQAEAVTKFFRGGGPAELRVAATDSRL